MTITPDALGHGYHLPSSHLETRYGTYPTLLTSSGHHWRPVQTCSLEDLPPLSMVYLVVKHIQLASKCYT